ncbi:hypothetical protein EDB83DRAFT_2318163 [Lactarius deliciosus]|nr:hypothetical protein EDB83DRAFT_2318163 [Lactarius deliciosus]
MLWGLVVAALCAMLRRGGSVGSCTTWRDVAGYWHVSGQGGGLACRIEVVWQGLAHHVEAAWQVGGVLHNVAGSWHVLGWGGGESAGGRVLRTVSGWHGGWWQLGLACPVEAVWWVSGVLACHVGSVRSCALCWGGEVGWQWQGVGAGWRWLACLNGLQRPG